MSTPSIEHAELSFRIDCETLQLFHGKDQSPQAEGPGEIYQDKEGVLHFTMHCQQGCSSLHQNLSQVLSQVQTGESISEESLFSLRATEYNGRTWVASHIIPVLALSFSDKGVVRGRISELKNHTQLPHSIEKHIVRIRISRKLKFPCNVKTESKTFIAGEENFSSLSLGAAIIEIDDEKIQINYEKNHTVISAHLPPERYSDNFYLRLRESFEFILAESLSISAIEVLHGDGLKYYLRSVNQEQIRPRFLPPLQYGDIDMGGNVYNLFKFFYLKTRDYDKPQPHPISHFLRNAVLSSAASLDTEILGLGVAVEGLIQVCCSEISPIEAEELSYIDLAKKMIGESCLPERLKNRITGALNGMTRPSASDKLKQFVDKYNLSDNLLSAWKKLRNKSAHGGIMSPSETEKHLKWKKDVTSLLYMIIFEAINYSGFYTDYSKTPESLEKWG